MGLPHKASVLPDVNDARSEILLNRKERNRAKRRMQRVGSLVTVLSGMFSDFSTGASTSGTDSVD